jgi:hypothetical protein
MPQVKAVLGHVSVETAKARRKCSRHKSGTAAHPIVKGEACLVVKDGDGSKHNYCHGSAEEILAAAAQDLAVLRAALGL